MAYEVSGKIAAIYDTVQRTESFRTREFVIEKSDDIGGRVVTNYIKFQCVQDKTAILDKIKIGDEVNVITLAAPNNTENACLLMVHLPGFNISCKQIKYVVYNQYQMKKRLRR